MTVTISPQNGFTALHLASQEGHTDMVLLLLENAAEVNCRAKNGLTPMHLAAPGRLGPSCRNTLQVWISDRLSDKGDFMLF